MRIIQLSQATAEIKQACGNALDTPFFYVVGAGISSPPIPRAAEIIRLLRDKAESGGRSVAFSGSSPMDEYSFWFQEAYPQPADRPSFLRSLMEDKPLSRANWRLAHLLSNGQIANVVVTPNFDDMLSRALTILGLPHVLCDHPATASRIDEQSSEIQILHVHGTYRFYDCCNLSGEIVNRAARSPLASRLDTLLSRRSPLVVGYSGWEQDVIMQALKRRTSDGERLPRNIYWFCYSQNTIESLPQWLREHLDVCFVVPPDAPAAPQNADIGMPALPETEKSLSSDRSNPPRLSAQAVFDALLETFGVPAPQITQDPLEFFASRLRQLLLEEEGEDEDDPYFLTDVVDRIERARDREARNTEESEAQIQNVLDLLRGANYAKASEAVAAVNLEQLSLLQLEKLADAVRVGARDPEIEPEVELLFYQHLQILMEAWLNRSEPPAVGASSAPTASSEVVT